MADATSDSLKETTDAAEEPTDAAEEPTDAAEEPTDAAEEPTDAAEEPTDAAEEPTDAAEEPTDAAEEPTDAAEEPLEASEAFTTTATEAQEPAPAPAPAEPVEGDPTLIILLVVAAIIAVFFGYALKRQRRRQREEMGEVEDVTEQVEPGTPETEPLPEAEQKEPLPPPVEEGPPASIEAAEEAARVEERRKETEKERRRREFLEKQRLAREAREREEAERVEKERAEEEEKARIEAEETTRREAEEAARKEALLASSGPLTERLTKTRGGFVGRLNSLLGKRIDEDTLEEIEEVLFTADIGVQTAGELLETVRDSLKKKDLAEPGRVLEELKAHIAEALGKNGASPGKEAIDLDACPKRPFVIMVIGVNGVGKTTTIGKLAGRYAAQGKKVILAAGDTFRAAAVEQLEVWAERVGCEVVKGTEGADPGSVTFDAVRKGAAEEADVVIVDTAGRLHTKVPLMEELRKVHRVLGKAREEAPDEVLLVVDATTGQNALQQARMFREAVQVTSIALTKLDGTAKGGVVIGITNELDLPVRYIGVGEKVGDLRPFDAKEFVSALFG